MVVAREDRPGDKRLVAYLLGKSERSASPGALRDFLTRGLPEYMVPRDFVWLERYPLTPTGKIDRGALPAPEWQSRDMEKSFVAPRTPVEVKLAGIWTGVLNLEPVGIHDDFFELGGHSLLATQVMSCVREAFHFEVPLRRLFEKPTIAGLAEKIEVLRILTQPRRGDPGAEGGRSNMKGPGTPPSSFCCSLTG